MKKSTLWSALIAFLASCRPTQKLTGIYYDKVTTPKMESRDTIILWKEKGFQYEIWKKSNIHFRDSSQKDTIISTITKGRERPLHKDIIDKQTREKIKVIPHQRRIIYDGHSFRKIGH
jgi:hypothetical protein